MRDVDDMVFQNEDWARLAQSNGHLQVALGSELAQDAYAKLRIWDIAKIMSHRFPAARFLVDGLFPEGVILLAGRAKIGKTFLALGIAVAKALVPCNT